MNSNDGRESPFLLVIVVTFNSSTFLARFLESVRVGAGSLEWGVIVVDNGSTDGTAELARRLRDVEVVEVGANLGYSGAINVARQFAGPETAIAILNPDAVVAPKALESLVTALHDPCVGIAAPRLVNNDGSTFPHLRREPSIVGALGDALFGNRWPTRPRFLTQGLLREGDYEETHDVAWAGGAALVISPLCNRAVGEWDSQRFFLYSEETDYQRRARDLGYRVRYVHTAHVMHEGGGSGTSAELIALMAVNAVRYFAGHHNLIATHVYRGAIALRYLLRCTDRSNRHALLVLAARRRWKELPSFPGTSEGSASPRSIVKWPTGSGAVS